MHEWKSWQNHCSVVDMSTHWLTTHANNCWHPAYFQILNSAYYDKGLKWITFLLTSHYSCGQLVYCRNSRVWYITHWFSGFKIFVPRHLTDREKICDLVKLDCGMLVGWLFLADRSDLPMCSSAGVWPEVLCFLICFSAYHGCKDWLFQLP